MFITRALSIDGFMSDGELITLANLADRSKVIVEVGCYKGRSTAALAENTTGTVYAVDPWSGDYDAKYPEWDLAYKSYIENGSENIFNEFKGNLKPFIDNGKVKINRMLFSDFKKIDNIDFIFIDAQHDYENVVRDILHAKEIMKSGIIAGHDYCNHWPGVIKAVDELVPKRKVANTIWMSKVEN